LKLKLTKKKFASSILNSKMRDIDCELFHTDHVENELKKIIKAPKENRLWELIPNGKLKNSPQFTTPKYLNLKYI
jgi:hypothetical protein